MKKIMKLIKTIIFMFFSSIILNLSLYAYAYITPKFSIKTNSTIEYYDINGEELFSKEEDYVNLNKISNNVKNAIVAIEDKNFYNHNGFDFLRIIKAMGINIINNDIVEGASTISQQYVKNLFLDFNKTWKRKIKEAYLTLELETHYSKNEILEGYLNTINFGAGNYGIKEASNYYFNKNPDELSLSEATILVGIPKNPTLYNPITNYDYAKKRQLIVLNSMANCGYIKESEVKDIFNTELTFYGKKDNLEVSSVYYYKDAIDDEMSRLSEIPKSLLDIEKIKIYTNLDIDVQKTLENNINNEMKNSNMEASSIVIEPSTGKILALVGGKNYNLSQYNRVTHSKRQVGSTIKPFLYYAALENGFTASSTFLSEKTTFNLGDTTYSPSNSNNIYANKEITLAAAIAYSDNIYAMKTHLFLGKEMLSNIIKKVKISTPVEQNASSALGTTEINMLDYSNGYITLANNGTYVKPHLIEKITDENDNILYEFNYEEEYILNQKYVYILNNLLTLTYNYNLVDYTSPTLISISNELNGKYAVKSGSTKSDYWTIGYNKNYLVMVWNGNDDNSDVKLSESRLVKKIWAKTISSLKEDDDGWYDIPKGITSSIIDAKTGSISLNSGLVCYYEKGTEPNYTYVDLYEKISN